MSDELFGKDNIEQMIADGAPIFAGTGGKIRHIRHDGTLLENFHADHPNYLGTIEVEYIGSEPEREPSDLETHAVIYKDASVILTIYECCFAIWGAVSGNCYGGNLWTKGEWRARPESWRPVLKGESR